MYRAAWAGAAYFGVVFALGFLLGTLRVLVIVPRLGESVAVLVELPIILTASWFVCRALVRALRVAPHWPARAVMGGLAFALLLAADFAVGVFAFGRGFAEQLASFGEPARATGLAAQVLFAIFPLWVGRRG